MRSLIVRLSFSLVLLSVLFAPTALLAEGEGPNDTLVPDALPDAPNVDAASAFCGPGVYSRAPELCPTYGPGAANARIASVQLPDKLPEFDYTLVDYDGKPPVKYDYARIITPNAPVFSSAADAAAGANPIRWYAPGFLFVSLVGSAQEGEGVYQINPGEWMREEDLTLYLTPPEYQGIVLDEQPTEPFGFVLRWFRPCRRPGVIVDVDVICDINTDVEPVDRENRFVILDTVKVGRWNWYLVGPDMWIDQRWMAVVTPSAPPDGVTGKWVDVNLYEQTVVAYEDDKMVYATLASTGLNIYPTRPGLFQVYEKLPDYKMGGAEGKPDYYYLENIPYIMYFDEGRSFHGTYWHNHFGYKRSHGCVNLSPRDAEWLYNWAEEGTHVYVHDPSGATPTDPEFYGFGAAP